MSYSKQNFRSGDTLYASQLNAMDDEIAALEAEVESTKNMVGSPLTASTAAGMTDQTKIYVYTGTETGYTAGHWYYYNGTAWTDGGVYNSVAVNTDTSLTVSGQAADSKAVGDAIDDLDSDLSDVKSDLQQSARVMESTKSGVDLDLTDTSGNVILRLADGHIQTKNFDSSDIAEKLDANQGSENAGKAMVVGSDGNLAPADVAIEVDDTLSQEGQAADAKAVGDAIAEIETGTSSAYVAVSNASDVDLDVTDTSGNVLVRFKNGEIHTKYFHSKPTVITLKTSGGDFSTLKAALDSITDANPETNPYEIHVYPGTYNTLEGFTDAEIRAADIGGGYTDQSMVGCKLTDGISLIGIGDRKKIILTAELSTSDYSLDIRGNISTLNLQGTCRIENLTIKAKNLRYCVHDDFGSSKHYERIVRNCVFSAFSWSLSYYPACTYGAGIASPGITALFENCDFGFTFGYHTRGSMTGDSNLVFKDCTGLTAKLGDQANESDTAFHSFYFDGCNMSAVSISRPTATTPHIFVYGTNNLHTMLFCKAEDIPKFSNLLKTTVSTLPVGTVVKVNNGGFTTNSEGIMASKAESIDSAIGVIMFKDSEYDYIQQDGYIQGEILGISGLSVGDYVTVDSDMLLTKSGASASNAFGVVKYTDSSDRSQIWIIRR